MCNYYNYENYPCCLYITTFLIATGTILPFIGPDDFEQTVSMGVIIGEVTFSICVLIEIFDSSRLSPFSKRIWAVNYIFITLLMHIFSTKILLEGIVITGLLYLFFFRKKVTTPKRPNIEFDSIDI